MSRETLLALAEQCEKATGPDRRIDATIFDWLRDNTCFVPNRADVAYPDYAFTASLDAALTLVPDDWFLNGVYQNGEGLTYGCLRKCNVGDVHSKGRTPALALCAAALRAQAGDA